MSTPHYGTPYTETEVLVAVMEGDYEGAKELLADMLPSELSTFAGNLINLRWLVSEARVRPVETAEVRDVL